MILSSIDQSSFGPYFYTEEADQEFGLNLQFDNGIDPDPSFSGTIFGKIYLGPKGQIHFTTWAKEKGPKRDEILFLGVKNFEFEFLGSNSVLEKGKKCFLRPINANLAWRSHWPKSLGSLPGIIRLKLYEEGKKEPLYYAFILPVAEPFVTYAGGAAI